MAKTEIYTCDGCGARKGATNHWWRLYDGTDGSGRPWLSMEPLSASVASSTEGITSGEYCGRTCVELAVEKWMEGK